MNSTKICCKYLGDLHAEAKHSFSGSIIYTDAPKDHDGEGQNFAPTDLIASALGTCIITIMGIEAKRRGWQLGEINVDVYKIMTDCWGARPNRSNPAVQGRVTRDPEEAAALEGHGHS